MSTDSFTSSSGNPAHHGPHGQFSAGTANPTESELTDLANQQLVQETRNQIRSLVDEITSLSETDCPPEDFYQGFLTRAATALAAVGAALWRVTDGNNLQLEYHINLGDTGLESDSTAAHMHTKLLYQVIETGQPALIPPRSGSAQNDAIANPTENLLIIGPLTIDGQVMGLLEIFQRPGAGPTTQRGYLRFVVQMCKLASDYLKNEQLRTFSQQQAFWHRLQSFVRAIHGSLDINETVYAIANEGRRVIGCDRVSVALQHGPRMQIRTMSGLDTIERRADQVKKLGKLSTTVCRAGQPLWYAGDDSDLPPQIEHQLHEYLDVSHSKILIIQPLRRRLPSSHDVQQSASENTVGPVIGALIIEQIADERLTPMIRDRLGTVSAHGSDALTNALTHSGIFLAPLWSWIGKTRVVSRARTLPKTIAVVSALLVLLAACWLIPAQFKLAANGKLTPEIQTEIFANIDGVLQQILVPEDPDKPVEPNQVLAIMSNNDLMVEIQNLQGQLQQAQEKVKKLQRAQASRMDPLEHRMVEGELAEALESQESLNRQLQLKLRQSEMLEVRAPVRGRVVNWQLRQNLLRRPVQRGQNLMTIVDPNTPWQIELEFPERRVAHLIDAVHASDKPLSVSFTLASHPGRQFVGQVSQIDSKLDVRSDEGNAVLVRVAFEQGQIPRDLLRSGTRVRAQINAGNRSLGYVWFHELFETIHSTWLLWF